MASAAAATASGSSGSGTSAGSAAGIAGSSGLVAGGGGGSGGVVLLDASGEPFEFGSVSMLFMFYPFYFRLVSKSIRYELAVIR